MVNVLHTYAVRKSSLPNASGGQTWDVIKIDDDMNMSAAYRVVEVRKGELTDYHCSCPAYKALCKHIHWVKSLKLAINRDERIIGGKFNPADHSWQFERNQEEED